MTDYFVIGVLVGVIGVIIVASALRMRKERSKYFAATEYWVYLPGDQIPTQETVMTAMVAQNPHARPGFTPIGPKEGILFSDIRLHVSQVLRSKNPHAFRPDLFQEAVSPSAEVLRALADAQSFVKLRYVSEVPLSDRRHLTFMVHLADAYARIGGATAIYDVVSERLYTPAEFHAAVGADADSTRPGLHLRVTWHRSDGPGIAKTHGLIKVGLEEVETAAAGADMQQLVSQVLAEAAEQMWATGSGDGPLVVEYFGDKFEATLAPKKGGGRELQIVRIQARG